ncbi:MAG: hypothetical protein HRU07_06695 [Nitrosopumilus sp.]|nr:hypothetical protein [Nitrosopumilus sp.]NRA05829.1 hypothetical protein [Nitrosopumilus sp.]
MGLLQSFNETTIPEYRSWFGGVISKQHYMRSFKEKYRNSPEILEKWIVECEFDDLDLTSEEVKIQLLERLNNIYPLTLEAAGEILGRKNFVSMVDMEKLKNMEKKTPRR